MKIVIVEDEIAIREGLNKMISGTTSHTVIGTCKNGEEGILFIRDKKPDLVITDICMNGMGGLEMLSCLRDMGEKVFSIIISGYSEFEYARQAMRLGVSEYLLKPVSIDSLHEALNRIEGMLAESSLKNVKKPGNYLREYLFGTPQEQKEAKKVLGRIFPEEKKKIFGIFIGYLGNVENKFLEDVEYPLRSVKHQFTELSYLDDWEESMRFRIMIAKGEAAELRRFTTAFHEMIQHNYQIQKKEVPWSMDICEKIGEWKKCFEDVKKMLSGGLAKGCTRLLLAKDFLEENPKELPYPMQMERRILTALQEGNFLEVQEGIGEFLLQIAREEYGAEEIRRGALKLASTMMDTAKEINRKAYGALQEEDYLKGILLAYTRTEIEQTLCHMGELICDRKKEGISNYTIDRTLEYIRTHYKEGISLEKTAEVLNITPEYLSMLFKREMEMNFSVFLKEFRISHAKRLLKGTDMKIYEVAQECGYSNSNYFTKVFKEVTGVSPAEYR